MSLLKVNQYTRGVLVYHLNLQVYCSVISTLLPTYNIRNIFIVGTLLCFIKKILLNTICTKSI